MLTAQVSLWNERFQLWKNGACEKAGVSLNTANAIGKKSKEKEV
jgi:hypothetical protein